VFGEDPRKGYFKGDTFLHPEMRFAVDLRYREVGEALGTSEEAARQSVHEGLKKLRARADDLKEMAK